MHHLGGRAFVAARSRSPPLLVVGSVCVFVYVALVQPYNFRSSSSSSSSTPQFEALSHHDSESSNRKGVLHNDDCLDGDTLLLLPTAPPIYDVESSSRPIPLLATNLDYDTEGFLARLLEGWSDAKARHKLVVAGGCDSSVLEAVAHVRSNHPDIAVYREREPLGCAPGWNRALDYMMYHADVEWCLIFNTDIYVPPGALDALAAEIWTEYDRDPGFCRGFFNVTAGPDATVFAFTRKGLQALGRFDENIYPAYYEDHEMDLRHNRSHGVCTTPPARFTAASLHHGKLESLEYKSGTSILRDRLNEERKQRRPGNLQAQAQQRERTLANRLDRGFKSSRLYVSAKWGCDAEQEQCEFLHPFNNPEHALSFWRLDWARRDCIIKQEGRVRACEYTLERPRGKNFPHPEALLVEQGRRRTGVRRFFGG